MQPTPQFPLQSAIVRPGKMRLTFDYSYNGMHEHSLCRVGLKVGLDGEQLGLWVGPAPKWQAGSDLKRWAAITTDDVITSVLTEYFNPDPF